MRTLRLVTVMAALSRIEPILHDLFKTAYQTNCMLESESLTAEEKETLEDLSPAEVIENLRDLLTDLLNFKRQHRDAEVSELARQNEQLEALLQKLEAEVRNHIRVEQQLKLLLEAAQCRVEELEKERKAGAKDRHSSSPVRHLELKLKQLEEKYKEEITRLSSQQKQAAARREDTALESKPHKVESDTRTRHSETSKDPKKSSSKDRILFKVASASSLHDSNKVEKPKGQTQRVPTHGFFIQKKREDGSGKPQEKVEKVCFQGAFRTYDQVKPHSRGSSDKAKFRPASAAVHPRSVSSLKA